MKRCPACGTTYTDATLTFCLADGSRLEETLDSDPTVISGKEKLLIDIPSAARTPQPLRREPVAPSSAGTWVKVFLGLFALGLLLIAVIGIAGAVYYFSSGRPANNAVAQKSPPPPTPAPSPTPDEEKKRLEDELANVQRRLDEAKKTAPSNTNPFPDSNTGPDPLDSLTVATVNSPNDGFLALRTEPDPDTGTRIAKIPHGAQVVVAMCQDERFTIGGRTGKWCLVGWDNYVGWVFDPFLAYSAKN